MIGSSDAVLGLRLQGELAAPRLDARNAPFLRQKRRLDPNIAVRSRQLRSRCGAAAQALREPCLVALANRFDAVAGGRASERDQRVLLEFLRAVAPEVRLLPVMRE